MLKQHHKILIIFQPSGIKYLLLLPLLSFKLLLLLLLLLLSLYPQCQYGSRVNLRMLEDVLATKHKVVPNPEMATFISSKVYFTVKVLRRAMVHVAVYCRDMCYWNILYLRDINSVAHAIINYFMSLH